MATIKVRVQGEIATNLTPEVKLVCQNEKYDVEFEFDESWVNSNFKTALFIYNGQLIAIPFDGTVCKIPALYETELLHIGVKSNDVVGLHTTTPAKVVYLLSANDLTSNKIPEPSKDVYDEIIALLNKYISGGGSIDLSDYQKKIDENLPTTNKTIVGAIAEVKEIAETAKMVFGETEGTAYEGNKGKENADNIAKLKNELAVVNVALEQSGLVKKYKQPIEQEYSERVTADGANVLDGSKAVVKKVIGNTVACKNLIDLTTVDTPTLNNTVYRRIEFNLPIGKYTIAFDKAIYWQGEGSGVNRTEAAADKTLFNLTITDTEDEWIHVRMIESSTTPWDYTNKFWVYAGTYSKDTMPPYQPYFTGLKSASFAGIESTNADGTETSTLIFPKTETPLGTTIDFENKKIVEAYSQYTFTGQESVFKYGAYGSNGYYRYFLEQKGVMMKTGTAQDGVCDKFPTDKGGWLYPLSECIRFGQSNGAIYLILKSDLTVEEVQALIAGMTVRYPIETPIETPFTEAQEAARNTYTAYTGGTETVLGNDNAEFGADNTLTQDYILVTEVK